MVSGRDFCFDTQNWMKTWAYSLCFDFCEFVLAFWWFLCLQTLELSIVELLKKNFSYYESIARNSTDSMKFRMGMRNSQHAGRAFRMWNWRKLKRVWRNNIVPWTFWTNPASDVWIENCDRKVPLKEEMPMTEEEFFENLLMEMFEDEQAQRFLNLEGKATNYNSMKEPKEETEIRCKKVITAAVQNMSLWG